MLSKEQKAEFHEILEELGNTLDISESQFDAAVKSYKAVGSWLCSEGSLLKPYNPTIKPQGSFLLGTTICPYDECQDLDIDLVCELSGKNALWTQKDLKDITGEYYRCVENPVNRAENFADKWRECPAKEKKFMEWIRRVKEDILVATNQRGAQNIIESLSKAFGPNQVSRTFTNIGRRKKQLTEEGKNRFDTKVGIIAGAANVIKPHNFYGSED